MITKIGEGTICAVVQNLIQNSIWITPSTSEQPSISLARWSVMGTQTGDYHLVGYNLNDHEGRVSTPIVAFDPVASRATTKTGRTYDLLGKSGYDSDGA